MYVLLSHELYEWEEDVNKVSVIGLFMNFPRVSDILPIICEEVAEEGEFPQYIVDKLLKEGVYNPDNDLVNEVTAAAFGSLYTLHHYRG